MSLSHALVFWDPATEGLGYKQRYEGDGVILMESIVLPTTVEQYYAALQWPLPTPGTLESENEERDPGAGLTYPALLNLAAYEVRGGK